MMIAHFNCSNGVSGNSILGALLDCGLPFDSLEAVLDDLLPNDDFELVFKKIDCLGYRATFFDAIVNQTAFDQRRSITTIESMINASHLQQSVKEHAVLVFHTLGHALALAHQCTLDEVTFHEAKAIDTIIDIVGTCWGLDYFKINQVITSPLHIGSGFITHRDNTWSIPTPATKILLHDIPYYQTCKEGELVTPTGAAIIKSITTKFGHSHPLNLKCVGYGAPIDPLEHPEWLTLTIGREKHETK
jgi:uncharacterized protein (DUF111 family)